MRRIPCALQDGDSYTVVPGSEFTVARTAQRNNESHYYINGRKVSTKDVTDMLKGKGIDLDNNRFLILQVSVGPSRGTHVSRKTGWLLWICQNPRNGPIIRGGAVVGAVHSCTRDARDSCVGGKMALLGRGLPALLASPAFIRSLGVARAAGAG